MKKELYLYSPIYDFVAESILAQINESMGENITMRCNTPGGSVFAMYGICAKIAEHGDITIKVDGCAMSSGALLLPYAKTVECLDVSTFMLHRADMYCESEEDKAFLAKVNSDLKAKLTSRVNPKKFKEVTGFSINEMFDSEQRIDINLTAKQAKEIGLVQKINKLSPQEIEAFESKLYSVAAIATPIQAIKQDQIINKMDINKLKAEHPAIFAEAIALGATQERERIEAIMVFNDIDSEKVKAAIESGKPLTAKDINELTLKAASKMKITAIKKDSTGNLIVEEPVAKAHDEKTEKEKEISAFEKEVRSKLGLK